MKKSEENIDQEINEKGKEDEELKEKRSRGKVKETKKRRKEK